MQVTFRCALFRRKEATKSGAHDVCQLSPTLLTPTLSYLIGVLFIPQPSKVWLSGKFCVSRVTTKRLGLRTKPLYGFLGGDYPLILPLLLAVLSLNTGSGCKCVIFWPVGLFILAFKPLYVKHITSVNYPFLFVFNNEKRLRLMLLFCFAFICLGK